MLAIKDVYPKLLACMKTRGGSRLSVIGTSGENWESAGDTAEEGKAAFTENYLAALRECDLVLLEDMEDQGHQSPVAWAGRHACNLADVWAMSDCGELPMWQRSATKRLRKYMPEPGATCMRARKEGPIRWTTRRQYEGQFSAWSSI